MDKVEDRMSKKIVTVTMSDNVISAAKKMAQNNISSLIVVEKNKPAGIITERDILRKIVVEEKDAAKVKVRDIATTEIVMINHDETIAQASKLMALGKIKQLPVMNKGKLAGIITSTDIVRAIRLMKEDLLNID